MADETKAVPPLDEIEVELLYKDGGKGVQKPYLVISLDALMTALYCENAILAEEDVPRLVGCLCAYARRSGTGDADLAAQWSKHFFDMVEDDE